MNNKIVIVGAGASGLCAAVFAYRKGARDITIIEKSDIPGKKLSMTGNGRCNLSNLNMNSDMFNAAANQKVNIALKNFGVKDTLAFFRSLGVLIKSEEGYLYPVSNQAKTIVQALVSEISRHKNEIEIRYKEQLKEIKSFEDHIDVRTDKEVISCRKVILSTGGLAGPKSTLSTGDAYYICKKLGMDIKDTFPCLVQLLSDDEALPAESGVRVDAIVSFTIGNEVFASEYGEVQITSKGISGIPVMQASGKVACHLAAGRPVEAVIDLLPDINDEDFEKLIEDMCGLDKNRSVRDFVNGLSNSNINEMILKKMKLSPDMKMKNISDSMARCILENFKHLKITITKAGDYQSAQVTAGGVSLGDLDDNMQSKKAPGVYVIGELCDVNGRCGGYNLQWAWSSAYTAATHAAGCLCT
ncbi:MAG: aminoacetone oxidase family FAD-binding enzyme [Butyrivibrio sp.]|nr:aminoacetone oxidase family FAD-binding enzyme [Butyrivibrio sp.]